MLGFSLFFCFKSKQQSFCEYFLFAILGYIKAQSVHIKKVPFMISLGNPELCFHLLYT